MLEEEIRVTLPFIKKLISKNTLLKQYFGKSSSTIEHTISVTIDVINEAINEGKKRHLVVFSVQKEVFKNKLSLKEVLSWTEQIIEVSSIFKAETKSIDSNGKKIKQREYTSDIKLDLVFKTSKAPTIYKPNDWIKRSQGYGYKGGYKDINRDLVTIKLDNKKQPDVSAKALSAINYIQKTEWSINQTMFDFLENNNEK